MQQIIVCLKQTIAILFLAPFLLQTFSKLLIVADYFVNTNRFAIHCENKNKPMLHCNGKCQMMKQLTKAEKSEQKNPERKAENRDEIFLLNYNSFFTIAQNNSGLLQQFIAVICIGFPTKIVLSIFHPPG